MDSGRMYDSQVQNETPSDEFVLHPRFPSLQEMAYCEIAIAVWYRYCSTPSQRQHYDVYDPDDWSTMKLELMDCHKLIKTLAMPRFMKENLKKYVKRVRQQTIGCTEYFRDLLFTTDFLVNKYGGLPLVDWEYIVWYPDGGINYKSTAIKILHSGVLTEVQKFAIVSYFCLESEMKSFNLNRRPMKTFISEVIGDYDPLLLYWIYYLKNESHRISPVSFLRSYGNYLQADGFEYFLNRLSAEDQVSFLSGRLPTFQGSYWYDSLFYKMSHDQLTNLLFRQPVGMILVFMEKIEMPEWAIIAWKRCKNWISDEQFVELLQRLFDRFHITRIHRQEDKMSVLLEIWNTANDHHKNYAARQARLGKAVVSRLLSGNPFKYSFPSDDAHLWKRLAPSSFKFLLKFLSLKSAYYRKCLIFQGDLSFIFNFDFNVVREILELCLPNFQGEVEFKNQRSKDIIRPYFCIILYTEDHDELNRRLLCSFQNLNIPLKDTLEKFIELLITANKREYKTHYPYNGNDESDMMRLGIFITKILQEDVSTVLKMKESYFSSFISGTSDPYERYGSLNELSKLIEQEFVHEHLHELKSRLAEKLKITSVERWVWIVRNYQSFKRVFSWCFENDEEMSRQVKRCIPINNISVEVFNRIAQRIASFTNLKRFLEWYFSGVEEELISFKLGLINYPETAKILEEIQKLDRQICRNFLQWIGHPVDRRAKRGTYGVVSFLLFIFFAVFSVIYVHL
ncbi:uncharacterized protein LOC135844715 [Planococcus citri]|uniref:uncharacterized protein LOC135844715 n=1 Tax=Planococcus citri TaxID=170843 RepID=UPI0031F8996C